MQNIRINRNKSNQQIIEKFLNRIDKSVLFQSSVRPIKDRTHSCLLKSLNGPHHARLGEYAVDLWKEKSMTDVLIVVQEKEFKAHKAVLACYSPYFSEVLVKPGFSDVHYLHLPNVTANAFGILLEFMYTGRLRVTCQELNEVYRSARKLGMKEAVKECIELLHVTDENLQHVVYLYVTARKMGLLDARQRAFKLMLNNFERLVTTKEFLDLEVDQLVELLSSDEIGARSEIIVFLAALKWLHHLYLDREVHIVLVLSCVRFPLMTMEEVVACYHPPLLPGIVNIPAIRTILLNATCFIAAKCIKQQNLFSQLSANPRTFLYEGEQPVLWDVAIFDPVKFEEIQRTKAATKIQAAFRGYLWRKNTKEDLYIAKCAATVIQSVFRGYRARKALKGESTSNNLLSDISLKAFGKMRDSQEISSTFPVMYVMGSFRLEKGPEDLNPIYTYEVREKIWEFVTKCPVPLHDSKMVSTSEALYICGGYNPLAKTITGSSRSLKDCHQYQFETGKWTQLPPMNQGRSLHGVALFNGSLLVIGGRDENNRILSSIEKYSSSTNQWEEFDPPLPEPRMGMGVACDGTTLWIAGGISRDGEHLNLCDSVWCFNKDNTRWIRKSTLPDPVAFPALLQNNGRLILLGGATQSTGEDKKQLESVDTVLTLQGQMWTKKEPMPVQCHSAIAASFGNKIFIFGGLQTQSMSQLSEAIFYDGDSDEWAHLCDLPHDAAGFIVALAEQRS